MLTSVPEPVQNLSVDPTPARIGRPGALRRIAPSRIPAGRTAAGRTAAGRTAPSPIAPSRIDAIEVRLRRLVDSCEPAIVFSSLVRLCVPAFSDACSVDIVEGGRVRYRITYPLIVPSWAAAVMGTDRSVVTTFASDLPGWPSYTGVMKSLWRTHRPTFEDQDRAAATVDRAIRMIRSERLADPVHSRMVAFSTTSTGGCRAVPDDAAVSTCGAGRIETRSSCPATSPRG